ncbi:unnamed protein product [Spirodela intermedia]|uniref:ASCH domain-containing protein n=1 Tax=Spirodela intermedia TaxID=51605 RepID=A0A7I8K1K6_SPIIN|nr:unnamed protein product [Spirodela intermedia]
MGMRGVASGGGGGGGGGGGYRNPCLTMHQPWASLLVHGIKRVEGRSWPAPLAGRLWIHAASKVPEPTAIKAVEDFYREIYAVNGITDLKFPEHYPTSRLLGCVEVVGCVKREELIHWEGVPESVRLEGQTDFCWLCEQPQKLLVPFEMRGYQGVYNLERKIFEAAVRGLRPVNPPQPIKFPRPDPHDQFSSKPGSIIADRHRITGPPVGKTATPNAAVGGMQVAATQMSKRNQSKDAVTQRNHSIQKNNRFELEEARKSASVPHRDDPGTAGSSNRKI